MIESPVEVARALIWEERRAWAQSGLNDFFAMHALVIRGEAAYRFRRDVSLSSGEFTSQPEGDAFLGLPIHYRYRDAPALPGVEIVTREHIEAILYEERRKRELVAEHFRRAPPSPIPK